MYDRARSASRSLLGVLLVSLAACATLPDQPGRQVEVQSVSGLEARNPADIAVAPLVIPDGVLASPPQKAVRTAFCRALVKRRYTPLAIDFVDARVVEAAYSPGSAREDAVLEIIVHSWDRSLWEVRTAILVDLEARLIDAEHPTAEPLWSGRMTQRFDFASERNRIVTEGALLQEACNQIAEEFLAALPVRDTSAGRP